MKLLNHKAKLIETPTTLQAGYKLVELVGRVSHRSEDKITDTSYIKFLENMVRLKHLSTLEFCPVYVVLPELPEEFKNKYCRHNHADGNYYITTNLRYIVENGLEVYLEFYEYTENHPKRITFQIQTNIGISREILRHRDMSFLEESTRYVNYSKKGLGFVTDIVDKDYLQVIEDTYNILIESGMKPQEARHILPLCTATRIYVCGFEDSWKHFLELRLPKNAHPEIRKVAKKIDKALGGS